MKEIRAINFCYADVNCRLRVKFHDEKQEEIFFSTFQELCDNIDCEVEVYLTLFIHCFNFTKLSHISVDIY